MPGEMLSATVPLAMSAAAVVAGGRIRDRRRRRALNRAIHELRRPLQAVMLASPDPSSFEPVLGALADLDAEVNGAPPELAPEPVEVRHLAESVVSRWARVADCAAARPALRWGAGRARVVGDRRQLTRALDNLVANAIEHGRGPIEVSSAVRRNRLRVLVRDGGREEPRPGGVALGFPGAVAPHRLRARRRAADPRRGHGLEIVRRVAAAHGGRFVLRSSPGLTLAVLELPVAEAPAPAGAPRPQRAAA
jgi:signal transduction histidine kinase